ncbi:prepilin peptidase [Granulibacter bethesdensis]|uniref:Prepilin leader peptidase/N-methyltransferase n=1 Tax=Granulibacter bethesdensis (strain ATCC BAA-1260 / CGDNIH1) TaxID=391165 RepID=Q0BRG4_GRABC|nr:A24 family peptidase [Granulibacter bethesdensis]ABI62588.1 Type 4 prepilin peptidase [Granulibacter bethesdensis CGDNIH1]AHJ68470.1 Type 4 prepilin peptidase [Granulibacter bethesdensis]APH52439.1 Type 4 prepilin peptidase [Granulibacter bethesdensis]APH65129.1 Type 4 prepilin peptidase [Granulibacter bethesdensis]
MGWLLLLIAPFIGSFLGVLIRRWPDGHGIVFGRSRCEHCGHPLSPAQMIPLLSFLWLRGRCRQCGSPIDPFHPMIECAALAVAVCACVARGINNPFLAGDCILGWALLALACIDLRHWRLPDVLTLPLILLGMGEAIWLDPATLLWPRVTGIAMAYGTLTALGVLYRLLRGREGLGAGDAKLFAAGAAWTGLTALPGILLLAALGGLIHAAIRASRGSSFSPHAAIPFGPALAAAIWIVRLLMFQDME